MSGTISGMSESAVGRFARWVVDRRDRPRLCAYGNTTIVEGERCERLVDPWFSKAAGLEGFCSPEHKAAATTDSLF